MDGDQAAVVSHISAGAAIEADVCNDFQIKDGQIAYMANFHDTVCPLLRRGPAPVSAR